MKDDQVQTEFTKPLKEFLERRGYDHILLLGIEPKEMNDANEPETGREIYWLQPVKDIDRDRVSKEPAQKFLPINHPEVIEFISGEGEIQYMMKVDAVDYMDYLKPR